VELNWTQVVTGVFTAVINAIAILVATYFVGKALKKIDKDLTDRNKKD
jgi:uncharacterized membrane protein YvlD (DUF360 family)